jgi:hypothetical protein
MSVPDGTYVDIVSGLTFNGPVMASGAFSWYNSGQNPNCTVTGLSAWCENSSYGPIAGGRWVAAKVKLVSTGFYSFACPCCQAGNPSVGVHHTPIPPLKK